MMLNHWRVHRAWLWLWLLVVSCQQHGSHAQDDQVFFNCELDDYYQIFQGELTLASWDRSDMADLLKDTHREVLPYTSSSREDVWDALVDLDASNDDEDDIDIDRIRLIYAQINIPALPHGVPATWNREHLWPKSRGVGTSGPDYTDIHALRPADWNVNSARSNLFFGDCQDACTSRPANAEAANDTAKNENVFLPPAKVRGDIARAIMYMELRYSFLDEPYTDVLKLTDCPVGDLDSNPSQMAYLSELLEWHIQDPPDEEEKIRNDRACTRWQGNRNIFVDYPDLALMLHGDPKTKPYNCNGEIPSPTPLPTTSPTMNDSPPSNSGEASPSPASAEIKGCSDLSPGDVQIIAINSDNPDSISLVVMENLPPDLELYITDNAWTGTGFRFNEGTAKVRRIYGECPHFLEICVLFSSHPSCFVFVLLLSSIFLVTSPFGGYCTGFYLWIRRNTLALHGCVGIYRKRPLCPVDGWRLGHCVLSQ
jgi:endonuclease I